ncbi:DUF1419 domain-containing protein [Nitratireductor sp. CH_MIT9313-5]|uniref:DUF1419 domain-containing protein n=1 Tax=Nitratireductor sp. CH_MIT9313-5 TaxID=3107764 RepID=UPI00300B1E6C
MTLSPIRKIYFGVADRRQMFRLFDRHAQRPNRWQNDDDALFAGEWFEIARPEHHYMLDILPPLWMRGEMFALGEFLTGSITSVFYALRINGADRYFHAYCDLARSGSPVEMRDAIVERERFSTRFGLLTAALETGLGLFLAVFLAPLIQRRFWLMAVLMMPMIIAPSLMGLMYRLVLHEFVGPLPYYLYEYLGASPSFLSPKSAFTTLVVIETLQWTPFTLLLFYTAYSTIPNDIREAARVDGTRGWRLFTHIELPALLPTLVVAFGIRFIDGFRVFDNIYVLIGSGAGGSSTSLSIYIYTAFFKAADIGKALAASVLLFIAAFAVLWLIARLAKRRART